MLQSIVLLNIKLYINNFLFIRKNQYVINFNFYLV
jgi:hypothetical protein